MMKLLIRSGACGSEYSRAVIETEDLGRREDHVGQDLPPHAHSVAVWICFSTQPTMMNELATGEQAPCRSCAAGVTSKNAPRNG
jgi:hypothetical protein